MLPPVVSLANNGDFGKVVGHFSLGSPFALEWYFAPLKFHFDPAFTYHAEFRSSETLLAACAIGLSSVISKSGEVDIRTIGLIHGGIFLLAMYLLIPVLGCFFGPKTRFAILVAIAATFCDVMYVSLFNSFYMDASALVFLLLTVVLFLRSWLWKRPADLIGFVISSLFLVTAKPQHVLMVIPMVVLIICYRKLCTVRGAPWVAAGVLTIATCWTAFSLPSDYTRNSIYTVIYIGLLPDSPSPADEMREFQLERADAAFIHTTAFSSDGGFANPAFVARFAERVHGGTLLRFYMRHPARAFKLLLRTLDDAGKMRPGSGNFDPGEGYPPGAISQAFAQWSDLKARVFARRGWRYLSFSVAIGALLLVRRSRLLSAVICLVIAMGLELLIAGLGDPTDAARHFTFFSALSDMALLILTLTTLRRLYT